MIHGLNNLRNTQSAATNAPAAKTGTGGASFSDMLQNSIDEVSKLQQDASSAVEDVATGKSQNVDGVMSAMNKADLAFKTLLAIRGKLMDAYEEIKNIPV